MQPSALLPSALQPDWLLSQADGHEHRVVPDVAVIPSGTDLTDATAALESVKLVIEILSPSTRDRDLGAKARLYLKSGIDWYWTVDLDAGEVHIRQRDGIAWTDHPYETWPAPFEVANLGL